MKNCWLLSRALKTAINDMMDLYFRGRVFDNMSEITDTYNQAKYVIFHSVMQKYGTINVHVDIKVTTDDVGKFYVEEMQIKRI